MGIKNYALSAAGNTSISGISIAESCPIANLNDADRYLLTDVRFEVAAFGTSTITAAATPTLDAEGGAQFLDGTTTITGFATATAGLTREVHFATSTPLTHSSTFALPGSANITTAAGDVFTFRSKGGSLGWKCVGYAKQNGKAAVTSVSASDIPNDTVTYAKMQNVSATSRLLGRASSGAGDVEEITIGNGLLLSSTTISGGKLYILQDQKTSGTDGGTATSGSWEKVTLNTEVVDQITITTASSVLAMAAGTYRARWSVPRYNVNLFQTRLRDTTNNVTLGTGSSEFSSSAGAFANTRSDGEAYFTLSGSANVELQCQVQTTQATNGNGRAGSFGTEVYAQLVIEQVA